MSQLDPPLLSPKALREFTAKEYKEYIKSLYIPPESKKKAKDWSFRVNEKGTPILTVRNRKPKFLTEEEREELKEVSGMRENELFLFLKKKGVSIKTEEKGVINE